MGNKPLRKNHALVPIVNPVDLSIPHHDLGVVRPGANASMESYFSSNSRESKTRFSSVGQPNVDRMGQPLVKIPNKRSNNGRREDNGVKSTIANFIGLLLPKSNLLEEVQIRKISVDSPSATSLMASSEAIKLIQICRSYPQINLLISSRE